MFLNKQCYFLRRFINRQAAAIHITDPDALVSLGVWNNIGNTDAFGLHDLFKDECLIAAGGEEEVCIESITDTPQSRRKATSLLYLPSIQHTVHYLFIPAYMRVCS